jgi:hypothetical protein
VLLIEGKKITEAQKFFGADPSRNNCRLLKSKVISSFYGIAEEFAKIKKYHNY